MANAILNSSSTSIRTGIINEYGVFDGVIVQGTDFTYSTEGFPVSGTVKRIYVQGPLIPELGSFRLSTLEVTSVAELNALYPGWFTPDYVTDIYLRMDGVTLTLSESDETFFGIGFNPVGYPVDDIIDGLGGNDTLIGQEGDDVLRGGQGDDLLSGGIGNDSLYGQNGDDELYGDSGADFLAGGNGHDRMEGGAGDDVMNGGSGNDVMYASASSELGDTGTDRMNGNAGDDILIGDAGHDRMSGGTGADMLVGQLGDDSLNGGAGDDQMYGDDDMDPFAAFGGNDRMAGGAGNDVMIGGGGNDRISGGTGDDAIAGGHGDDRMFGNDGNDVLVAQSGANQMTGGAGFDTFAVAQDGMSGSAIVRDFNLLEDLLVIEGYGADRSAQYSSFLENAVQSGSNVVWTNNAYNYGITLRDVALSDLTEDHFTGDGTLAYM